MTATIHPLRLFHRIPSRSLAFLAVAILMLPLHAHAQWAKLEASQLAGVFLYSVDFETPAIGHAIGSVSGAASIYRTTDAGATWEKLKGIGLNPFSVAFLDANTGLVGGRATGCQCAAISRTTDGGKTWKMDSMRSATGGIDKIPASFGVSGFTVMDASLAYASGSNGMVYKTTDGGVHWQRRSLEVETDFIGGVSFPVQERGYVVAASAENLYSATVLHRTTDGGDTWQRIPEFLGGAGFADIHFTGSEVGFIAGTDGHGAIYKTTDGGASWERKFSTGASSDVIFGIEFQNQNVGYAVGSKGLIVRTTDGGETWSPEQSGTTNTLQGISITDGKVYVVGGGGTVLLRSADASGVGAGRASGAESLLAPNPVTTTATLSNPALARNDASLVICNLLGSEVRRIAGGPGMETIRFSREGLSSGTYLYRVMAGTEVLSTGTMEVR